MSVLKVKNFCLEGGNKIDELELYYDTFGTLNEDKSNVVWVCHALTANSNVLDWWDGLFGKYNLIDPKEYFIVCVNSPGSCYGSTGPATPGVNTRPSLEKFPSLTVRDVVSAFDLVREHLGLNRIKLLVGSSLGGQQALEWSIQKPDVFESLALIATNARHSPYGIAFNESQRLAIKADETYGGGNINGGKKGLVAARSIALLSYRSYEIYDATQNTEFSLEKELKASKYQQYQGEKLARRFSAYSYDCLTNVMDSHDVGRGRESIISALRKVKARTLVVGISSDQLFPLKEQKFLSKHIAGAEYVEISSDYGHDGFLVETQKLSLILEDFLYNNFKNYKPTVFRTTVRKSQLMNLIG